MTDGVIAGDGWTARLATPHDNTALCALMRTIPLGGWPQVAQERDDFFLLPTLHGGHSETYIVEDGTGRAVGCGTHVVREAWLDGKRVRAGHVGDLRVAPEFRGGRVLPHLARMGLERSHRQHGTVLSTMAAMRSNRRARRAATSRNASRTVQPISVALADYRMMSVPMRPAAMPAEVACAGPDDLDEVAAFLAEGQRSRLLGWVLDRRALQARLETWPGLRLEDFLLVRRSGRLVGCAAPWDPSPARRTRVLRWGPLAAYRKAQATVAPWRGRVALPAAGGVLRTSYLTHLEVEGDDPRIMRSLLAAALARGSGAQTVAALVPEGSQLASAFRGLGAHTLPCTLLGVSPAAAFPATPAAPPVRLGLELALA